MGRPGSRVLRWGRVRVVKDSVAENLKIMQREKKRTEVKFHRFRGIIGKKNSRGNAKTNE